MPSPRPWTKGSSGEGKRSETRVQVELGVWPMFEMGSISQRKSVAQEEEARQSSPYEHTSSGTIRQPGSDVPASVLPLSHTEKL